MRLTDAVVLRYAKVRASANRNANGRVSILSRARITSAQANEIERRIKQIQGERPWHAANRIDPERLMKEMVVEHVRGMDPVAMALQAVPQQMISGYLSMVQMFGTAEEKQQAKGIQEDAAKTPPPPFKDLYRRSLVLLRRSLVRMPGGERRLREVDRELRELAAGREGPQLRQLNAQMEMMRRQMQRKMPKELEIPEVKLPPRPKAPVGRTPPGFWDSAEEARNRAVVRRRLKQLRVHSPVTAPQGRGDR